MLNREYAIRTPPDCVSLEAQSHEKSKIYLTPSARQCYIQSSSPLSDVLFPLFFSKIFHFACHRTFFTFRFHLASHTNYTADTQWNIHAFFRSESHRCAGVHSIQLHTCLSLEDAIREVEEHTAHRYRCVAPSVNFSTHSNPFGSDISFQGL